MTVCRGEQPALALIGFLLAAAGCLADLGECFPSVLSLPLLGVLLLDVRWEPEVV